MIIAACGLVLLFVSNQAIVFVNYLYPPFGFATISFIGLSSYLLLIGIYSSAVSVSGDSKLRRSIRGIAMQESRLLDSIGSAQMEQEIQKKVLRVTKEQEKALREETGVHSSLNEEDIKRYLSKVLQELETLRKTSHQ